jgi:hypothetical protein
MERYDFLEMIPYGFLKFRNINEHRRFAVRLLG